MIRRLSTLIPGLALVAASASAGVVWISKSTSETNKDATRTVKLAGKSMRTDTGDTTMIVRLDKALVWSVHNKDKTYNEMTFTEMGAMMEQMKGALAQMPPEMRAQMEKMMNAQVTVAATGEEKTVAGHGCAVYTVDVGPAHVTLCSAKDLPMAAEAKVFWESMNETLAKMKGLDFLRASAGAYMKIPGVPVEESSVVKTPMGEKKESWSLVSYDSTDIPPSAFELPEGYKKVDSGMGAMRGGMPGGPGHGGPGARAPVPNTPAQQAPPTK